MAKNSQPMLRTCFSFHNVGQGLFYSGNIGDFRFVYDCGSTWKDHLKNVVTNYVRYLPSQKIQLLVLSHLHDDHVAGLDALLNQSKISIETVIMPYLSPIERLSVALTHPNLDTWFYEFWANPVEYLIERGVGTIVFLGGSEPSRYGREEESLYYQKPFPPEDFPSERRSTNESEKLDLSQMPIDNNLREEIRTNDTQWSRYFRGNRIQTRAHTGNLSLATTRGLWLFRLFNCHVKDTNLARFERCVRKTAGKNSLIKVINSSSLKKLRGCYRSLHGDFNNTSIVMYHAPCFPRPNKTNPSNYDGHLLTGDIDASGKLSEIDTHFGSLLKHVAQCSVPHHGSRKNWNRNLLTLLHPDCRLIISSGIANLYHHPHSAVIKDILSNNNPLSLINEVNRTCTMMYF